MFPLHINWLHYGPVLVYDPFYYLYLSIGLYNASERDWLWSATFSTADGVETLLEVTFPAPDGIVLPVLAVSAQAVPVLAAPDELWRLPVSLLLTAIVLLPEASMLVFESVVAFVHSDTVLFVSSWIKLTAVVVSLSRLEVIATSVTPCAAVVLSFCLVVFTSDAAWLFSGLLAGSWLACMG